MSVTVTFDETRIGRHHNVAPLVTTETEPLRILAAIERYAGKFLSSRGIDADYYPEQGDGIITVGGYRPVARFRISGLDAEPQSGNPA